GNTLSPSRPKGSRNKRTQEILDLIAERGDTDPIDFLSGVVSGNGQYTTEQKTQAANYLLPYKHSKCGSTVPLRYIPEPINLPRPTTIDQATNNIATISEMKAQGQLDLDFADSLIRDNRTILDALIEEQSAGWTKRANNPHRRWPPDTPRHECHH